MLFNFYALGLSWGEALTPTGQLHWGHTPLMGRGSLQSICFTVQKCIIQTSVNCHLFALLKDYTKEHNEDLEDSPNIEV